MTTLNQGDVDNLPNFFFINEFKDVAMAKDRGSEQKHGRVVCSTEDCGQPSLKYCKQCEYLCKQCYDDHSKFRVTKSHIVIRASEGDAFTKSKVPPYPPCHRHKNEAVDLYCRTCNMPVCVTCSQSDHQSHDCCDLDKQAEVCKTKLEQICEDRLIDVVKKAIDKTKCHEKQADADIDDACDNVKSTFTIIHEKLNQKENNMLTKLQNIRRRVKQTVHTTLNSQMMTLARLESLKSCQVKLVEKNSPYDFSTVTDSIQRDVENHFSKEFPGIIWKNQTVRNTYRREVNLVESGEVIEVTGSVASDKQVEVTGSVASDKQVEVKEVSRIRLHDQDKGAVWGILGYVWGMLASSVVSRIRLHAQDKGDMYGMVVYHERVYVVHSKGLIVYCYTPDGSLSHKYEHKGGEKANIRGMCLMIDGDTAMSVTLVIQL